MLTYLSDSARAKPNDDFVLEVKFKRYVSKYARVHR